MSLKKNLLALTATATLALYAAPAAALKIELINVGGVTAGTDIHKGFTQAARFWEKALTNDVTVRLEVNYAALGAGVIGSTGSTTNVSYVGPLLDALRSAGNSKLDSIARDNLVASRASGFVGGQAVDALISAPKANGNGVNTSPLTRVLDADAGANNSAFSANTSLLKALGITPTYTGAAATNQRDGIVTFSSNFAFDFDPTNGIDAGKMDFLGVAIHEIGHALGFRSGVDTYDGNTNLGANLGNFAIMSVWDLFRYSEESADQGVRDWAIGGNPFFSIDGGQSIYDGDAFMATGRNFGDGRQASHWKDAHSGDPQLGVMDPTSAFGQQQYIDSLDLAAFDAMGWNVAYDVMWLNERRFSTAELVNIDTFAVPEPGMLALSLAAVGLMGIARRRKAS
ncbi:MAG: NF038122 family metalloprotease [Inhella sp.]